MRIPKFSLGSAGSQPPAPTGPQKYEPLPLDPKLSPIIISRSGDVHLAVPRVNVFAVLIGTPFFILSFNKSVHTCFLLFCIIFVCRLFGIASGKRDAGIIEIEVAALDCRLPSVYFCGPTDGTTY